MTVVSAERRSPHHGVEVGADVRLSEVVSALSFALDITEGQPQGHAVRTCLIVMRLASEIGLSESERSSLFYALLLKDLGCSSNAARLAQLFQADDLLLKHVHKLTDWTSVRAAARYAFQYSKPGTGALERALHVLTLGVFGRGSGEEMTATRCERGAEIAARLSLDGATQDAIRALDEHWDGSGRPRGLRGTQIPLLGRLCSLAQTVEVFHASYGLEAAMDMARARTGKWFEPALVGALEFVHRDHAFWALLDSDEPHSLVSKLEPHDRLLFADESRLDQVATAFAMVIDAKSPYTARHSEGVAFLAQSMAHAMNLPEQDVTLLRRAGLLHDIGKLGISNLILDKPGRLSEDEMVTMRRHPAFTFEILDRVRRFRDVAEIAAAHHERLDGQGYHRGLRASDLCQRSRILAVADVCEALSAVRPYRPALNRDEVTVKLREMAGTGLCEEAVEAVCGLPAWF